MRNLSGMARARAAAPLLLSLLTLTPLTAQAHGFAGDRFFPATIAVDDPAVADELSLPTASKIKNGDGVQETDVSTEFSKRITDHFGVSVANTWTHLKPGETGFQNLEATFKYQFLTDAKHELIISAGLSTEFANTGAKSIGAEGFNSYTPTLFFGKGFGDLPEDFNLVRPFAITGQVGYAIPGRGKTVTFSSDANTDEIGPDIEHNARTIEWGLTLQYSLPYLNANVRAIEGDDADFLKRLIPIVEASFSTPVFNFDGPQTTTGTVNPGVIWSGRYMQLGVEAMIPINKESGRNVGGIAQVHFYLDDIFAASPLGKPLF